MKTWLRVSATRIEGSEKRSLNFRAYRNRFWPWPFYATMETLNSEEALVVRALELVKRVAAEE